MSCFSVVLGDERQSKWDNERFLRREITPNIALQPTCEDARG